MKKGFTLIELLVVIAIIGVMMAAVIVSINPTKRLQDARDSNKKQIIASIGGAMEACYTKNEAVWTSCLNPTLLVTGGYLKIDPTTNVPAPATWTYGTAAGCAAVTLENGDPTTCTVWKYDTATGKAACAMTGCS